MLLASSFPVQYFGLVSWCHTTWSVREAKGSILEHWQNVWCIAALAPVMLGAGHLWNKSFQKEPFMAKLFKFEVLGRNSLIPEKLCSGPESEIDKNPFFFQFFFFVLFCVFALFSLVWDWKTDIFGRLR